MTVHLGVSFVALGLLCWILRGLARSDGTPARLSWVPLAFAILVVLPLGFGPIVPITHFVFEFSSNNITWYVILGAALWAVAGFFFWRCVQQRRLPTGSLTVLGVIWTIMAFWYVLGVRLSQKEPGVRTPQVTDSPIYIAHWASAHLALLALFFLLARSLAAGRWSWFGIVVTAGLFVLYLSLVFFGVIELN